MTRLHVGKTARGHIRVNIPHLLLCRLTWCCRDGFKYLQKFQAEQGLEVRQLYTRPRKKESLKTL